QPEAARWTVRRIQLVDGKFRAMGIAGQIGQQMPQRAIDQPWQRFVLAESMLFRELLKRDFKLVELVVARLVDARRLAGRPDELAGKEIRQRGMVLPVSHQALQQIGTSQKRTVRGR